MIRPLLSDLTQTKARASYQEQFETYLQHRGELVPKLPSIEIVVLLSDSFNRQLRGYYGLLNPQSHNESLPMVSEFLSLKKYYDEFLEKGTLLDSKVVIVEVQRHFSDPYMLVQETKV